MASTLKVIRALTEKTANELTTLHGNWQRFLDTSAQLYKYSFPDQMLIYAQKPDAVAVAEIDLWNEKFDRFVKRGTKGIALIDDTGSYQRLKYVFDVNDTYSLRHNAKPVQLWEMKPEHKDAVIAELVKNYEDIDDNDSLTDAFRSIARQLAAEYYSDNAHDIQYRAEDSVLAPQALYDSDGMAFDERDGSFLESTFVEILTNSIAYSVMSRCGLDVDSEFDNEDFQAIADFNTTDMVFAIGTATSELSEQVLRDVELTIRKYERVKTAQVERSEQAYDRNPYLQPSGRLSSPEPQAVGIAGGTNTARQIRTDEESVPQGAQDNQLQPPAADREAVPAFAGGGRGGEPQARTGDEPVDGADESARQGDRPDGLDGGNEHAEIASGGNGDERTDLRIEQSETGAAEEAAPFSMAEQAQHHVRWNELILDAVVHDETILNAAVNSDKENTVTEIESLLNRLHLAIRQDIIDSSMSNKSGAINELGAYFTRDRKPPMTEQLYDSVIRSDPYKERLAQNETPSEQETPVTDSVSTVSENNRVNIGDLLKASSIRLYEVDAILRDGGNFDSHKLHNIPYNSRSSLRIAAHFAKNRDDNELFLQREYLRGLYNRNDTPSGKGFDFAGAPGVSSHHICAWFDVDGISLAVGTTAKNNIHKVTIPWEVAAERIRELYDAGQYVTPDMLTTALDNEHRELAGSLWHFYRDEMGGIPDEWDSEKGGYPEDVEKIKGLLDNPETLQMLIDRVNADIAAYNPEEHERRWHNRHRLLYDVHAVGYAPTYPPQAEIDSKQFKYFITQDEIDARLTHGSSFSEGKFRTLSFFLNHSDEKERITFLKDEYGTGGGTWSEGNGHEDHTPGEGITLKRGAIFEVDAEVNLKWNAVARRIDALIKGGLYMSRPELDSLQSYERLILVRNINSFYYELPEEYTRPFSKELDYFYPHENEWNALNDLLNDGERLDATISQMRYIFENTPDNDRYYSTRKNALERLTAFRDGTYTLFPGVENLTTPEAAAERQIAPPRRDNGVVINLSDNGDDRFGEPPRAASQMTLFDAMEQIQPKLPSVEEQQQRIDRSLREEAAEIKAASDILENDVDGVLLNISDEDKARLYEQFADNPRSRAAVNLVKEVYGSALPFPLPQAIKRLGELAELWRLDGIGDPYNMFDRVRDELSERGYAVSGEFIEDGLNEFRSQIGHGDFSDVADYIENEYLSDEPDVEYDIPQAKSAPLDVLSEVTRIKDEHGNPIVMWQVGDFYEMYGDDAVNSAAALAVSMTERIRDVPTPYLVTGIPGNKLDEYRQKLNDAGYSVAVSSIGEGNERNLVLYTVETQPVAAAEQPETDAPWKYDLLSDKAVYLEDGNVGYPRYSYLGGLQIGVIIADEQGREHEREYSRKLLESVLEKDSRNDYLLITPHQQVSVDRADAAEPVPLAQDVPDPDFETVAQTVYDRVMADDNYAYHLRFAQSRGSLRSPLNDALDKVIGEMKAEEPAVYGGYFNDDITDDLFDRIYRESWANRPQPEAEQARVTETEQKPESAFGEFTEITDPAELAEIEAIFGGAKEPEQTAIPPVSGRSERDESEQSNEIPSYEQYLRAKERYPDHIALTTNGDYNELHGADALFAVNAFGYTPDYRNINSQSVPYVSIPKKDADTLIARLGERGCDVAYVNTYGAMAVYPHSDLDFIREQLYPDTAPAAPTPESSNRNFRITDDHLGEGGAKTKYRANIEAIKIIRDIEQRGYNATADEQETLSHYVGWGGLPQAFDENNKDWANEYAELKSLLTPEEYDMARASTLNAHYTSPVVIKAMWETIGQLGFKSGNVLEPSMGVGNFFGLIPQEMWQSKLYGVELDSMTAQIAKQLYPKANIQQIGYEKTEFSDAFFDVAIGNVPFGGYQVADARYKQGFPIHDYFFQKTLDKVRPGGVVAFVTSKFTLDKQNPEARKYMAQRAELLGAVRLPNNAFLKNAGTETTMDILFLQKRDRPIDIEPDWVHLGKTEDGIPVNRYFLDNPEMILGVMGLDEHMNNKYGRDDYTACLPTEGADLGEQLKTALSYIQGEFTVDELDDLDGVDNHAIPADYSVKNFSYTEVDGTVYFRENSLMYPVDLPATTLNRIKGMIGLRGCVQELIALQLDDYGEDEIKAKQAELSDLYDGFIAEYGLVNSTANNRAFSADSAYYLLSSLEVLNEDGELDRKADMFTKRTIKQKTVITHVDTSSEALAVSLGERARVDLDYMSELTGFSIDKLTADLQGVIYCDIGNPNRALPNFNPDKMKMYEKFPFVTADEYLSGNVREKLARAKQFQEVCGDEFHGVNVLGNIAALEAAQPVDLEAGEISVRLGSTWIDPEYVQEFMYDLLDTNWRNQSVYQVKYHQYTGEWQVTGKGKSQFSDIPATVTFGTGRMNAYQIIDDTLNLRDVRVYDYKEDADGKERRVLNKKETMLAQQKQELIKQKFKDWIWQDPERRQTLVQKYNEMFNSVRTREYDGSHITFGGISPEIELKQHQLNAIAHILYGGNTLLAHVVGAGKTFEMTAAAMESKRLGLCHKSLFAVPNHLTEQWASEFLRLYPSANILVATKKDFEMRNRKKFCAKIATGDYDAVIIGHSQLEKIPMSRERQERLLNEQIWEIEQGIKELKESNGERYSIKNLEKTKRNLEARLTKLLDSKKRDDVVTFEQLGVDRLYVDEAHNFKNLFLYTKMRNVAGLSTSEAQKSSDLFMKCRYMDELTDGKGTIFATGTPISNSITEMYTMQRYLQYDTLQAKNLSHFDAWASTFGETTTSIELAPEGTGYRARTRFAQFHNLPELMSMFKDVADIKTADMLNLPVPEAKFENIIVEPSELQKEMVQELSERAAAVHNKEVDPSTDNMLKITTDGRKIGLDQRLINPLLPDFEGSKVNACAENVYQIWNETHADRLTQLLFCDFSTPNKDGRFNIYDDIRAKLIERGIPEHEIAFIHDADTETKKKELFAKVRQGKVRVLFGSTFKMGAGTNVQDRLVAIHDADCPWRPADLEQRSGRIIRQGNMNPEVKIFRYATSGTFDSYLWQTVQKKQEFIAQIMSSKSPVRSCDDVDETALSYAEIKALCAGNPLIAEKMALDNEVAKLRMLRSEHRSQHYRLEDSLLKTFPQQIKSVTERIEGVEKDIAAYAAQKEKCSQVIMTGGAASVESKFPGMVVNGVTHVEKEPAGKALLEACKGVTDKTDKPIGEYMGFKMSLSFDSFSKQFKLLLRGNLTYQLDLGTDTFGNITRINHALDDLPKRLEGLQSQLENYNKQTEAAKTELAQPFPQEAELAEKEARLALLNSDLNIDGNGDMDVLNDTENREESGEEKSRRDDVSDDYDEPEERGELLPRTGTYGKAAPTFLDNIRSLGEKKRGNPQPGGKSADIEI